MLWRFTHYDPTLDAIEQFRRRMANLLDELDRGRDYEPAVGGWPLSYVYETAENYRVRAEVPGIPEDALKLKVHQNTLTISGERLSDAPEGYSVHRQERGPVSFSRSFSFRTEVDAEKTTANVRDGILTVTLPKAAAAKAREIPVKLG